MAVSMSRVTRLVLAATAALVLTHACVEPVCEPGLQQSCVCPQGGEGVQACNEEGSAFDACQCDAVSAFTCPPSAVEPCSCSDGSESVRRCDPAGTTWSPCECDGEIPILPTASGGAGGGSGGVGGDGGDGGACDDIGCACATGIDCRPPLTCDTVCTCTPTTADNALLGKVITPGTTYLDEVVCPGMGTWFGGTILSNTPVHVEVEERVPFFLPDDPDLMGFELDLFPRFGPFDTPIASGVIISDGQSWSLEVDHLYTATDGKFVARVTANRPAAFSILATW